MTKLMLAAAFGLALSVAPASARMEQGQILSPSVRDSYAQGTMRDLADRRAARKEMMKQGGGMHRGPRGGMMRRGMHPRQRHHVN